VFPANETQILLGNSAFKRSYFLRLTETLFFEINSDAKTEFMLAQSLVVNNFILEKNTSKNFKP